MNTRAIETVRRQFGEGELVRLEASDRLSELPGAHGRTERDLERFSALATAVMAIESRSWQGCP